MKSLLLLCPKGMDIHQPTLLEAAWKSGANSEEEAYAIAAQAMQIIINQQREQAIKNTSDTDNLTHMLAIKNNASRDASSTGLSLKT